MTETDEDFPRAISVVVMDRRATITLTDGRRFTVPLRTFPLLRDATLIQLAHFTLLGQGKYLRWPELDEDLSIAGLARDWAK